MAPSHPLLAAPKRSAANGFTLIEVMVVIALIAILATLASPAWNQLLARNAIRSAVNDFSGSLQFARSEAVRLNSPITLCPSSDGVNCTDSTFDAGWIVRTGPATNDDDSQVILQDTLPRSLVRMDATDEDNRKFTFLPNGLPSNGFASATVEVCPANSNLSSLIRRMTFARTGKATLSTPAECAI